MRARTLILLGLVATCAFVGCVTAEDQPTTVRDLRVLGMRFEPPEVMIPGCNAQVLLGSVMNFDGGTQVGIPPAVAFAFFAAASTPLEFTALVADPAGNGRQLDYRLLGCANRGDRECDNEGDYVEISSGQTTAGELKISGVALGTKVLDDGTTDGGFPLADGGQGSLLMFEVIQQDTFKGLGGIRIPVVLELSAADTGEKIYAQKLMVYTCQFFPQMKQNVTPVLPGVVFNKVTWREDEVIEVHGKTDWELTVEDFAPLQENYLVPSLQLQPVALTEAWKVTWMTTSGTMSPYNTGGIDFAGETGRQISKWRPDQRSTEPADVTMYFVVRDGRGGNSWLTRRLKWWPE